MRLSFAVALALLTTGCRPSYYSLQVIDRAGEPCTGVTVEFGKWRERFPSREDIPWVNGGEKSISASYPDPAPTEATIRWTAGGRSHGQTVSLPPRRGDELRDTKYVFVIRHDGSVRSAPFTHAECIAFAPHKLACDGGPVYSVGIKNATPAAIRNAAVWFGKYPVTGCEVGPPPAGVTAWTWKPNEWGQSTVLHWYQTYPITDTAAITWEDAAGVAQRREIPLRAALPADLEGKVLCFVIHEDRVDLRVVPFADLRSGRLPDLHPGWK